MSSTQPPTIPTASQDEPLMRRALHLAAQTVALASPNPQVGCILVRDGEILGEGTHRYDTFDHAEIVALKDAARRGHTPAGAIAYVTLEPCAHHGRTGPCADALIAARIARAVVATEDPNPAVSGGGIARLRAAGIEVSLGLLETEARTLNDAFAHFIRHRTPFVTLKAALSVDGGLAPHPARRAPNQPHWLTGPAAQADVGHLRHAADALLTGIGTVLADNPRLTDRTGQPRRRPLQRIVLDTHLRTPLTSRLVLSAQNDVTILCGESAPPGNAAALRAAGAEILSLPGHAGHLSLPAVLSLLAERNLTSLLLEAGSALNGAFLREDLVDRVILYYAETELGPGAIPFAAGHPSPYLLVESLRRVTRTSFPHGPEPHDSGEDIRIAGYLHDPWSPKSR